MSLRRKACNACYKGRRKCNLAYPTCDTCQRTKKTCQYAYPPISPPRSDNHSTASDSSIAQLAIHDDTLESLLSIINDSDMGFMETGDISGLLEPSTPFPDPGLASNLMIPEPPSLLETTARFVGSLGEVQPIQGSTQSWQWVIDELKHVLPELAQQGQTIFIHRDLYRKSMPQAIRTSLGVSSMSCMLSDTNREMLFRIIDAEVLGLLQPKDPTSLLDDLAILQALIIYQTVRFFHGDITQRMVAEQQQDILMTSALKLVVRSQSEPPNTRYSWIIAESIRRTAIIVYMLYGVNSIFRDGVCIGLHTLAKLPLSTTLTDWDSTSDQSTTAFGSIITYENFLARWLVSTPRSLDRFEKLLLVPCQGLDSVNAYTNSAVAL
ncbi:hypothetical protein ASPVEDRAFT_34507 [Aspergillus versicolor CBS 583.65]|uniref:Zn(2)-C6 fungal-type domain-containing protein n=1 Tax=Aspergillus versicolor CBS 583.65 TaxID=1036611 RepID=A0A1L9Q3P1_ASPVE|nr:uncharacterized protein ASPVEDRAFT_34507 [Aspergillus versicolor CBS 583.65]OJJ08342.1 hypothetical protein ASPVEDRAFT_34507 [Aspergillus versicolor CBS 583.65]